MHWSESLLKNVSGVQKISTGISPSGPIHIGNMREILTGDIIYKEARKLGIDASFIYLCDDIDPLRKVYPFLPKSYEKYVGHPLSKIPAPEGDKTYSEYFLEPFKDTIYKIDVRPEIISTTSLYKNGILSKAIDIAMNNRDKIKEILNSIGNYKITGDWYPYEPICRSCGRINSTTVTYYSYPYAEYKCKCGYTGRADIRTDDGKMPWRVEWPAKWFSLHVTIEPFGKDHGAAGGSYDTGKAIARDVFKIEPPMPLLYERIFLKGMGVMHSSTGVVIPASEMIKFSPPEIIRFLIAKNNPGRHIDFDPGIGLLNLIDEYEKYERAYFGLDNVKDEDYKDVYELSRLKILNEPEKITFRHIVTLVQIYNSDESLLSALKRSGYERNYIDDYIMNEIKTARYWLEKYAPAEIKFSLTNENMEINDDERRLLTNFIENINNVEWSPDSLHNYIYDIIGRSNMKPQDAFAVFYRILIGKNRGPRLGYFMYNLGRDYIIKRFSSVLNTALY